MSKLPRFFLGQSDFSQRKIYISDLDAVKHARKILRLKIGDRVEIFDGMGNTYLGEILKLTNDVMVVEVLDSISSESNRPYIILAQGLPKAGKLEDILKMNTEVGVREFLLFESDYSVVKREHINPKKLDRYRKIITEAARQSENDYLPIINSAISFNEMLKTDADYKILLNPSSKSDIGLDELRGKLASTSKVLIVIGPEGGFSPIELESARAEGFQTISLNTGILRTQTAGVVVAGFLLA